MMKDYLCTVGSLFS